MNLAGVDSVAPVMAGTGEDERRGLYSPGVRVLPGGQGCGPIREQSRVATAFTDLLWRHGGVASKCVSMPY
jgi:hypothetical protein